MSGEIAVKKEMPELSLEIIKKYICPTASEQEAYMFLQLCKAQNLNPFLREAYLIKYGTAPATIVTGKETFTKRADRLPQYDGFKAGIILQSNNQIVYREGSFFTSGEILLGGWAEVYRKDRSIPFRNEVKLEEYEGHTHEGGVNKMWREKKATMIRKVPLMQSLREAFPDEFGGMYSPEEINTVDTSNMPTYEMGQHPQIPIPAQERPPITQPQAKKAETQQQTVDVISEPQRKRLFAISKKAGITDEEMKAFLAGYGFTSSKLITRDKYEEICSRAEDGNISTINIPGCTENPATCELSIWDDKQIPYCGDSGDAGGGLICKYLVENA